MITCTIVRDGVNSDPVYVRDADIQSWLTSELQDPTIDRIIVKETDTFSADGENLYNLLIANLPNGSNMPTWDTLSKNKQNAYSTIATAIGTQWASTH